MRIQILPLPSVVVGDDVQEPFALIVDQHDSDMDETTAEAWQQFKTSAGARALLITPDTVEVVDRYAEASAQASGPDADAGIAAVQELHCRTEGGTCEHCSENDYPNYSVSWPCPTIRAATGSPS